MSLIEGIHKGRCIVARSITELLRGQSTHAFSGRLARWSTKPQTLRAACTPECSTGEPTAPTCGSTTLASKLGKRCSDRFEFFNLCPLLNDQSHRKTITHARDDPLLVPSILISRTLSFVVGHLQ